MIQDPFSRIRLEEVCIERQVHLLGKFHLDRHDQVELRGAGIHFERLPTQVEQLDLAGRSIHHVEEHLHERPHAGIALDFQSLH